ncbi:MAG: DNA methyltransferase [Nitrososphaeraceae archaeon]
MALDMVSDGLQKLGTGTTGVAALKLNRKFIGIEKDNETFEIAKSRISN